MKLRKAFVAVAVALLLVATLFATGCNTWRGAGEDVERAGEKMQGD
jgi:predicted small secreted protein